MSLQIENPKSYAFPLKKVKWVPEQQNGWLSSDFPEETNSIPRPAKQATGQTNKETKQGNSTGS